VLAGNGKALLEPMSSINDMHASDVINEGHLSRYEVESPVLRDDLVYLSTNLALVTQLNDFDADLFEAPSQLLNYIGQALLTECAVISARLWKDSSKGTLTLDRFASWVLDPGLRPEYRGQLKAMLSSASLTDETQKTIERLRSIRHARLAHINHRVIRGLSQAPEPVAIDEIQAVAGALASYFNALTFGDDHNLVVIPFGSSGDKWHEGDLGYVLDRIALDSTWLTLVDEFPQLWPDLRRGLGRGELSKINEVRVRYNKKPLS